MTVAALKSLIILLVCGLTSASGDGAIETSTVSITTDSTRTNFTNLSPTKLPKFQVTRTALHVARSLDPDSTETVQVRTRTGDVATLIVRKRGGKSNLAVPLPVSVSSSIVNVDDERVGKSNIPSSVFVNPSAYHSGDDKVGKTMQDVINVVEPPKNLLPSSIYGQQRSINNLDEQSIRVPSPVNIKSSPMRVKGEQQRPREFWNRGRSVMHIDSDGIPVIHGVRMPDDESDRKTWRNARVINGILVPYENSTPSSEKQVIARKATVQLEGPETSEKFGGESNPFNPSPNTENVPKKSHHYNFPHSSDTHARIIEYINTVNQRETERRSRSQNRAHVIKFPASRRSDETQYKMEGRELGDYELQGRVLQYPGSSNYPTSLLYTPPSQKASRVSFEGVRTPVLQYAHPELGVQPARVMSKQDEEEKIEESGQHESHIKGVSKGNSLSLAYFAQDIHSDRSPYAYEPGTEANEEQTEVSGTENNNYDKRSSNNDPSMGKNSHLWPKKSFAYLHQQPNEDTYGLGNDKYIKRFPYNGYNNAHSGPNKDNFNRYKNMIGGSEFSRYPHGGHYNFHPQANQERPFWERISETIRDHVQSSMEKMSDITRPVVEPLVEATQKISHNLGFVGDSNRHIIQDKVGSTVAAYPVLLPALGLVAGGAALGLGAVAVGRYLDVDVMKRRVGERSEDFEVEHKRTLENIMNNLGERNIPHEEGTWVIAEEFKDPDQQKKVLDSAVRPLSDRHQDSRQDDTQRKALEEIVRTLQDKYNNQQRHGKMKIIANVFTSLNDNPMTNIETETWEVGKDYNPSQDDKVHSTFGRQAVWSRADDVQKQDEQEKDALETIVRTLSAEERFGHGEGSWTNSKESPENDIQKGRGNISKVTRNNIIENNRQIEENSSKDGGIIFVVAEEPKGQIGSRLMFPRMDARKLYFRREDELNQGIIDEFPIGSVHRYFDTSNIESRITKKFGGNEEKEPAFRQDNDRHILSKRSTGKRKITEDEIRKLDKSKEYLDNILHNLKSSEEEILANMATLDVHHKNDWSNTPCAKKIFCDAMVKQSPDAVLLMEKKMSTFLSLIQPNEAVSYHLNDVMEAVKRHDCSMFTCSTAVDASRVETPNRGPAPR